MAKGFAEFFGFDPLTGQNAEFRLQIPIVERFARYSPGHKLDDLYCVKDIVESPQVAFRGLRTVDAAFGDPREYVSVPDETGLCFAGIPSGAALHRSDARGEVAAGRVFAVFMDGRRWISDWDWIRADPEYPSRPIGWERRFRELIWSRD